MASASVQLEQDEHRFYPPPPEAVPPLLAAPSRRYKRHAWLAALMLLAFVGLYCSLCFVFASVAVRNLAGATVGGRASVVGFFTGGIALVLAVFLVKALFGVTRAARARDFEVTPETEPELFRFLYRLADETRAPRPHRVFLSPLVNAAVFYDRSFLNLLFPSKKNLELGLGLVNVLTLSDLKAVLAHEFGHFAQRSMSVGRWTYVAEQIAGDVVMRRDWFDRALARLSSMDLRIAWIGWIFRSIVWSLRALLDSMFALVVLAQRALAREMEFQADLVSVSVSGSDGIVHALHRLNAADQAMDAALTLAATELSRGRRVPDLFALQSRVIEHMRVILSDPGYGLPPERPVDGSADHRLFEEQLAQPPKMWSTHPSNREREDNAKRRYVGAVRDDRSAWLLVRDPSELRRAVTAHALDGAIGSREVTAATPEEALASLDAHFLRTAFHPGYRGMYLRRSPLLHVERTTELLDTTISSENLAARLAALYPAVLSPKVKRLRILEEELASLEALREGVLHAPGGVIRHRGRPLKRRELSTAIAEVKRELGTLGAELSGHDRECRSLHRLAADELGRGWPEHLHGLLSLAHYAAHTGADLDDARGHLANVLAVVTADGRVNEAERYRLVSAATELYTAIRNVDERKRKVIVCEPVARRLGIGSFRLVLPDRLTLEAPSLQNIGEWLNVIQRFYRAYRGPVAALEDAALDALLEAESLVTRAYLTGDDPGSAPNAGRAPKRYATRVPGTERQRQRRLPLWDRFVNADGMLLAGARFALAAAIVGGVVGFGASVGHAQVVVYNAFDFPVTVSLGPRRIDVFPHDAARYEVEPSSKLHVEARTNGGYRIEAFDADVSSLRTYVYNVGGASPLVEWTASYGYAARVPERPLGHPRFLETTADVLFRDPPSKLSMTGKSDTRTVLTGYAGVSPAPMLQRLTTDREREAVTLIHAEHVDAGSPNAALWLQRLLALPEFEQVLAARLSRNPADLALVRLEESATSPETRRSLCARLANLTALKADNVHVEYVRAQCIDARAERNRLLVELYDRNPDHAHAAIVAGKVATSAQRFEEATRAFLAASKSEALRSSAVNMLQRVHRVHPERPLPPDLLHESKETMELLSLETGQGVPEGAKAYMHLAKGALTEALRVSDGNTEERPRVVILAAASDGATPEMVKTALSLPAEFTAATTVWSALALTTRERGNTAALVSRAKQIDDPDTESLLTHLQQPGFFEDAAAVRSAAAELNPLAGAQLYVMGSILKGNAAPPEWRRLASGLLFASERPYFDLTATAKRSPKVTR
jgi:Zn-dependent protease with chaperone function